MPGNLTARQYKAVRVSYFEILSPDNTSCAKFYADSKCGFKYTLEYEKFVLIVSPKVIVTTKGTVM